jgi:two-component system sensor histidine kinase CpxA
MTLTPRSIYTKIFLWFCLTIAVSTGLVVVFAGLTSSGPFGRRWMAMTQDLYAHSAVDFYITGGAPALQRYLTTIDHSSGIEGHLLDAAGHDVLGASFPEHAISVYRRAQHTNNSAAKLGRYWTAASIVDLAATARSPATRYIFLLQAHPMRGFLDGTFFLAFAPRVLAGALLVALFCLLLARHITRPIRILQAATARMSGGDLSVRTMPAMRGRADELADMAAAFDRMAERIETLLRTQRQMLADISHELRSPLTRVSVSLELLRRGELDVIEPMQADLDRLNQMIGQILELARFELQDPAAPTSEIDLRLILEDVIESANYEGRASGKSVSLTATQTAPSLVAGEGGALYSCVENIVRNALQYSPPGGRIAVSLSHSEPHTLSVLVEDDGPGVPEEALPQLFAPFFRVPATAAAHPHGNGLGLSIASRVAARCGGSIVAANRLPHGLAVRLTLPCIDRT